MFQRFSRHGLAPIPEQGAGRLEITSLRIGVTDLLCIVLVLALAPMAALRACARLPETVQERVEALQVTWERTQLG